MEMAIVRDRLPDEILGQAKGRIGDDANVVHLDRLREIIADHGYAAALPTIIDHVTSMPLDDSATTVRFFVASSPQS